MVSHEEIARVLEAAAAAKSCKVTPEEVGWLSAFLVKMPENELKLAPMRSGTAAVVAFVRARYRDQATAAGVGVGSAAGAAGPELFNNITVFVPGRSGYVKRKYSELSKDKFITKILREGSTRVVRVNAQPSKVLVVDDCADTAVDVDDVQLQDDIQLAVVVRAEDAINKLVPTPAPGGDDSGLEGGPNRCGEVLRCGMGQGILRRRGGCPTLVR